MPLFQESKLWLELISLKKGDHRVGRITFSHGQSDLGYSCLNSSDTLWRKYQFRLLNEKSQPSLHARIGTSF